MRYSHPNAVTSTHPIALDAEATAHYRDLAVALLSAPSAPPSLTSIDIPALLALAEQDGLLGLLFDAVNGRADADRFPLALLDGLRAGAHRQAARELVQRVELQRVIAAMHARGVDVLLMKGASLAFDVYPDPAWRVRSDVDLFIRADDRTAARACFADLGYACEPEASGRLIAYQFHCERNDAGRVRHLFDVHWKIANPQRFAEAVGFEELAAAAVPLPRIGPDARGLGRPHALWLACVHRAAHHYDQQTLVWLYDVHLLVRALDAAGLHEFVALAERTGVRRICLRALVLARERFGTPIAAPAIAALEAAPLDEPSALFLGPRVRRVDVLLDDVRVLRGWSARFTLLKEHLLPDAAYMRRTYANGSSAPIGWLYVRRIATGASKWFRP
ncbi:MAG TPA: nucleotidyltransferase family protein [Vicinamibacterales bacterium]|nr:nucleotidyltransferase family protein [Vicinamibacterales bacterium]